MTPPAGSTTSSPTPWYRQASKLVTAGASTGAACVSIFSFLYSFGILGKSESHRTIGNLGVAWLGVRPLVDTATAIGDTLHLAATITDKAGAILVGTTPAWSSEKPAVAEVHGDGSVIAVGPGTTTITVAVGGLVARSRIVVRQRVATVNLVGADAADGMTVRELDRQPLRALVRDARGHPIVGVTPQWRTDDSSVVVLDSAGIATARAPGRTIVSAAVDGVVAHAALSVVAAAASVDLVAGGGQHAAAGRALPQNVVVRIVSRRGLPVSGALVTFRPADGGVAEPVSALSDADGRARTAWTLGELPGGQSLIATVPHLDSTLVVTAEADPLRENTRATVLADHPSGRAALPLADAVQLRVTDSSGRALPDVPVSWLAFDGAVEPLAPRTDSAGIARARWILGPTAGTQRLRAQVGTSRGGAAITPVTITATALAGVAARLAVVSGDRQRGVVGVPLRRPVVVRVLDAAGNGVADAALVVADRSDVLPDTLVRTDSSGSVALTWTLGRSAGSQSLTVRMDGLAKSLGVVAWAEPGAPANLAIDEVRGSPDRAGKRRLMATVIDLYGNPVPNATLRLTARGGRVSPSRAVSDRRGAVPLTWTPGSGATLSGAVAGTDVRDTYALHAGAEVLQAGAPIGQSASAKVKTNIRARVPR